jgi:serine protease Do
MRLTQRKRSITLGLALSSALSVGAGAALVTAGHSTKSQPVAMMDAISPETREAIESAGHLSTAFRAVADHLLPSVVMIENRPTVAAVNGPSNGGHSARPSAVPNAEQNPFKGTPFEDMFRGHPMPGLPGGPMMPKGYGRQMPSPSSGIGSGVIIDSSGIILTNNHVVKGGEITVRTHDGREFVASKVWLDPDSDLAVVKIDGAEGLVPAMLGDSDDVAIGDWVVALGQPFGLESTVTAGIISAKHRGIGITPRENFLQTDAAINPGNSGGPLVNLHGEVIGINTAISSRGGGNDGIGFAVPSNLARWVSTQLIEHGSVKRAYLGVGIQPVTQDLAKELGIKPRGGVLVTDVYEDTPAKTMGLQSGDVIISFAGKPVATPQALQMAVERSPLNRDVEVRVKRDGKTMEMTYRGTEASKEFAARAGSAGEPAPTATSEMGIEVAELDAEVSQSLGIDGDHGVLITAVTTGSAAERAGLEPGMVVLEVDRAKVDRVEDFAAAMKRSAEEDDSTLLLVRTAKGSRFVVLKSS